MLRALGIETRTAVRMVIVLTVLTGLIYPLIMTGVAQVVFPFQANGSLVKDAQGNVIGSELIGQYFADPKYFHPRPSAAVDPTAAPNGYNAASSGASNLGPTNQKLSDAVKGYAAAYRQENGLSDDTPVPVDAVTTSGSGLDPQITPANAFLQAPRVAKARNLPEQQVVDLVRQNVEGRALGFLGEDRVNVLKLNLALDKIGR
jgi:K+-transporting ATPase ATPase C chain